MKITINPKTSYSEWVFDEEEIKTINEKGKLICEPQFIKHFTNVLMKLVVEVNQHLDEKTAKILTQKIMPNSEE
jgi:hypothetical protein